MNNVIVVDLTGYGLVFMNGYIVVVYVMWWFEKIIRLLHIAFCEA